MKFLALEVEREGVPAEAFTAERKRAEAARAWELYQEGTLRELYFRGDRCAAVLVLECADLEAAQVALNSLPLAAEELIAFEIIPLVAYPGFARLFGGE